jgi:3-oxoisoapionate kinase
MSGILRYIFIADDFTGASDTLATLARAGQRARLFLDVPTLDEVADLDAFGIATEARAYGSVEIETLMDRIGTQLAAHQPEILHYKVCSTFDSAFDTGNFVAATDRLSRSLGISNRAIVGGQPSLGRYCAFGNLFARASDGKTYRIDRHPVMRSHPVTPMSESDLQVHFSNLGGDDICLSDRLEPDMAIGTTTLFDALDSSDITRIGTVLWQAPKPLLCVGASSVAQALFGTAPHALPLTAHSYGGPVLVFVGSRSQVSSIQTKQAGTYAQIPIAPLASNTDEIAQRAIALLGQNKNVLIHIKDDGLTTPNARDTAQASARLITGIVSKTQIGVLVVAGGDTSSAIIKELSPQSLSSAGDIDPGVPLCIAHFASGWKLPVVLKGGQVGRPSLFDYISQELVAG